MASHLGGADKTALRKYECEHAGEGSSGPGQPFVRSACDVLVDHVLDNLAVRQMRLPEQARGPQTRGREAVSDGPLERRALERLGNINHDPMAQERESNRRIMNSGATMRAHLQQLDG